MNIIKFFLLGISFGIGMRSESADLTTLPRDIRGLIGNLLQATDFANYKSLCRRTYEGAIASEITRVNQFLSDPKLRFSSYGEGHFVMHFPRFTKTIHIKESFDLSDHITQEQFVDMMGLNPSQFPKETMNCGKNRDPKQEVEIYKGVAICRGWPVTDTTMLEKQGFIQMLNRVNELQGNPERYDLPFEQEEGYAQVGGVSSKEDQGPWGTKNIKTSEEFQKVAVVGKSVDDGPGPVDQLPPFPNPNGVRNPLGLVMTQTRSLDREESRDPEEFSRSQQEVKSGRKGEFRYNDPSFFSVRGAAWISPPEDIDVGDSDWANTIQKYRWVGFRLLRTRSLSVANGTKSH